MRLSKRGEYGLRAMIDLASWSGDRKAIQLKEIADRENIPIKYLEQIMLALKNAGLVNSRMGINGGYYLSQPVESISLGQIIRILDGPLAPIRCVSQTAYEPCNCPDEDTCGLRKVMFRVRNAIADILDNQTLAEVVHNQQQVNNSKSNPLKE
jgi:Rrf2 family protein